MWEFDLVSLMCLCNVHLYITYNYIFSLYNYISLLLTNLPTSIYIYIYFYIQVNEREFGALPPKQLQDVREKYKNEGNQSQNTVTDYMYSMYSIVYIVQYIWGWVFVYNIEYINESCIVGS